MDNRLRAAHRQVSQAHAVRSWGHRPRVYRFVIALLGAVLVVPPLSLAPASAAPSHAEGVAESSGLLPLLDPTVLLPEISGAGQITGVADVVCSNLSGTEGVPVPCADGLTLTELANLGDTLTLVPIPASGWEFAGWSGGGCTGLTNCDLAKATLSGLTTALDPVAVFLPTDDPTVPGACDSPVEVPGADCAAPETTLTKSPQVATDKKTKETTAAFEFKAYETDADGKATTTETSGATFECQLTGPGQTAGFAACTSPKSYSGLTDGAYTFSVKASDTADPANVDESPATFTWTVQTAPPETRITSGPGRWVVTRSSTFGYAIDPAGDATYSCTLDDSGRLCGTDSVRLKYGTGTHVFGVAGTDSLGNTDATAATRTFTLPVNDRDLKRSQGWTKGKGKGYFLKTFVKSKKKGATLKYSSGDIKRIALVVTKAKGYGVVKVFLGKKLLKKVSLSAKHTHKRKVVNVAKFARARSGKVKIVVASKGRPVVIEGLGIASR